MLKCQVLVMIKLFLMVNIYVYVRSKQHSGMDREFCQ